MPGEWVASLPPLGGRAVIRGLVPTMSERRERGLRRGEAPGPSGRPPKDPLGGA